jgi:hypothetical protein
MLNLIMSIVLGILSLAGLVALLRLLLTLQSRTDRHFTRKYPRQSKGYQWGIKIPTKAGEILQFYFYAIMGKKHYTNYSSWPVKIALLISILLFLGFITNRRFTGEYYSFSLTSPDGMNPYLHGGSILWYLHMVNLAYLGLLVLVSFDSVRMMGWYAPIRIGVIALAVLASALTSLLSFFMLVIFSFLYVAFRILKFFFRSRHHVYKERKPSMLSKYYAQFLEVQNEFDYPDIDNSNVRVRKKPRNPRLDHYDDNIPRIRSKG